MPDERLIDPDCPLCEADRITPWHHEDDICWIADCEICATPMVVWRGHGTEPPQTERDHMMAELARIAETVFDGHWVDGQMRNIERTLGRMETEAPGLAGVVDIGTITYGCALGYLDLRFAQIDWRGAYPNLKKLGDKLALRQSFIDTAPRSA